MSDPLNDALYEAANDILEEAAPMAWYADPDVVSFKDRNKFPRMVSYNAIRHLFEAMRDLEALPKASPR
jgi:hypothetical protein